MRFLLLMLATIAGAVACQKDQPLSNSTKNTAEASALAKSAAGAAARAAPSADEESGGEPTGDEVVPATDKSGVDNAGSEEDDPEGSDTELEE